MFGVLSLVLFVLVLLLGIEYVSLRRLTEETLELKEEYGSYVLACKRLLVESDRAYALQAGVDGIPNGGDEVIGPEQPFKFTLSFPAGSKIFSSDGVESDDDLAASTFLPINRDLDYLEQAAEAFIASQEPSTQIPAIKANGGKKRPAAKPRKRMAVKTPVRKAKRSSSGDVYSGLQRDFLFSYPVERSRFWISSRFGKRKMSGGGVRFHYGLDMAALKGTAVKAAASGVVATAGYSPGYGNSVVLIHNRKYKTRYAHLNKIGVKVGQKVSRGELIGTVGDTGNVRKAGKDGSHLHFEVLAFGRQLNPLNFLR